MKNMGMRQPRMCKSRASVLQLSLSLSRSLPVKHPAFCQPAFESRSPLFGDTRALPGDIFTFSHFHGQGQSPQGQLCQIDGCARQYSLSATQCPDQSFNANLPQWIPATCHFPFGFSNWWFSWFPFYTGKWNPSLEKSNSSKAREYVPILPEL